MHQDNSKQGRSSGKEVLNITLRVWQVLVSLLLIIGLGGYTNASPLWWLAALFIWLVLAVIIGGSIICGSYPASTSATGELWVLAAFVLIGSILPGIALFNIPEANRVHAEEARVALRGTETTI